MPTKESSSAPATLGGGNSSHTEAEAIGSRRHKHALALTPQGWKHIKITGHEQTQQQHGSPSAAKSLTVSGRDGQNRPHGWGRPSLKALQNFLIVFSESSPHSVGWGVLCEKPFLTVLEVIQQASFKTSLCPALSNACVCPRATSHDNPGGSRERNTTSSVCFLDSRHHFNEKLNLLWCFQRVEKKKKKQQRWKLKAVGPGS